MAEYRQLLCFQIQVKAFLAKNGLTILPLIIFHSRTTYIAYGLNIHTTRKNIKLLWIKKIISFNCKIVTLIKYFDPTGASCSLDSSNQTHSKEWRVVGISCVVLWSRCPHCC